MKKYFKLGLATIVPVGLVALVLNWLYVTFNDLMLLVLPSSWGWHWWYVPIFIVVVFLILFILGFIVGAILSKFKLAIWSKKQFDNIMAKVPVINKIYSFGLEISDTLIADGKFDGEIKVVEVMYAGHLQLGLLTNVGKVFIPTVPNPMNGFLVKTTEYTFVDMSVEEMLKVVTSLGKICGSKWK
jgi:uncharacterized membrane protein